MGEAILVGGRMGAVEQKIYKWKEYLANSTNWYYWNRFNAVETITYTWNKYNTATRYTWDRWNTISWYVWERWSTRIDTTYYSQSQSVKGMVGFGSSAIWCWAMNVNFASNRGWYGSAIHPPVNYQDAMYNKYFHIVGTNDIRNGYSTVTYFRFYNAGTSNTSARPADGNYDSFFFAQSWDEMPSGGASGWLYFNGIRYWQTSQSNTVIDTFANHVGSTDPGSYPNGGIWADNYWYGNRTSSLVKGTTQSGTVSTIDDPTGYPNPGLVGSFWYENRSQATVQGSTLQGQVTAVNNPNAYPPNGLSGSNWYVSAGSTSAWSKGSTSYSQVSSTNSGAYSMDGHDGTYWYVYDHFEVVYSQGSYKGDRLSTDRDRFPDNGYSDGCWYVFDGEA